MHLMRCLVFYASLCRFDFIGEHIPGVHNGAADAIFSPATDPASNSNPEP